MGNYRIISHGNTGQRDQIRSMQLIQQAAQHTGDENDVDALFGFFREFATYFPTGRSAWRLQYLTDLTTLPDYGVPTYHDQTGGAPVTEDTLALDLVDKLGFSGDFLSTDHTLQHFREQWDPDLFDRHEYEGWKQRGRRTTQDAVRDRIEGILAEPSSSHLPADVDRRLADISTAVKNSAKEGEK